METTVKFKYGPASFEIYALEGEDYQRELLDLIDFLDENEEKFEMFGVHSEAPGMDQSGREDSSLDEFLPALPEDVEEESEEDTPLSPLASELKRSTEDLTEFLYADPERDANPVLYMEEIEETGERKVDEQRLGSLLLLYLWHRCYEVSRVKSTALKDALELSGVPSSGMANMYQGDGDRFFDRRGRGPSATVSLTAPGKREARKRISQIVDQRNGALDS